MVDRLGGNVVITVIILSMLVVTMTAWWTVSRRRHRTTESRFDNLPLLAVPAAPAQIARPGQVATEDRRRALARANLAAEPSGDRPTEPRNSYGPPTVRTRDGESGPVGRPAGMVPSANAYDETGEAVEGASVRYWRAADGTLQFLPGRLELAAGRDAGQEIRFVRTAGPDGTSVTFGRAEGAPYRHVQLREPTVSRSHARMSLDALGAAAGATGPDGAQASRWRLENLSATNPVLVNGRSLAADEGPRASVILSDGDRIEMGEVVFIFRSR
jgi:hypothetical protein